MKTITTNLLLAVAMLLFTTVYAQEKQIPNAEDRSAKLTDWMKTNLKLTEEQEPKVKDINLRYATKMDELRNSSQAKRQKLKTLKENDAAKDGELKQVFTEEQFKAYQAKKEEIKQKFKEEIKARRQEG